MKNVILCTSVVFLMFQSLDSTCYKCEEIKEKNKNLPPLKYEFYDDYIEAQKAEGKPIPGDIAFEDESSDESEKKD
jgi:hypothetical protein